MTEKYKLLLSNHTYLTKIIYEGPFSITFSYGYSIDINKAININKTHNINHFFNMYLLSHDQLIQKYGLKEIYLYSEIKYLNNGKQHLNVIDFIKIE